MTSDKLMPQHLERLAYVYIRQSTLQQVASHRESQRRQRQLVSRPRELGWPEDRVLVIDEDLGLSAARNERRGGFDDMVAATATGQVGVIVALEISRLARSNQDWYHLLDICAVRGTLLADGSGLYDPREYNDRLLLGLWGTMSETELHVMKQRLVEAMRAQAKRGEFRYRLPPGYLWDAQGRMVKEPDQQIQATIALVFERFAQVGTLHTTHRSLLDDGVLVPVLRGPGRAMVWKPPTYGYVQRMLKNPLYAGAYVWGRREVVEELDDAHRPVKRIRWRDSKDWPALLHDHHESYIPWEVFERNQRQIAANRRNTSGPGPVREGRSLLQGLVLCGQCGRRMRIRYSRSGRSAWMRYECDGGRSSRGACQGVGAIRLEQAVEKLVLQALAPVGMQAMLAAAAAEDSSRAARHAHWEQRIERAQYEVELARRQYDAVDPDNRLVAAELERRWELALGSLEEVQAEAARQLAAIEPPLNDSQRQRLLHYADSLGELWHQPTTRPQDRKRIVRCLITNVVIEPTDRSVRGRIHWQGGETTDVEVPRRRRGDAACVTDAEVVDLIRKLARQFSDSQIARILKRRRQRTAKGLPFTRMRVANLRFRHDIPKGPAPPKLGDNDVYTAVEAADLLDVDSGTVVRWIEVGLLQGAQMTFGAPWRVRVSAEDIERLKPAKAPEGWVTLKAAAAALGVSQQTVLQRLDAGEIEGVRVRSGRRKMWRIRLPSGTYDSQASLFD